MFVTFSKLAFVADNLRIGKLFDIHCSTTMITIVALNSQNAIITFPSPLQERTTAGACNKYFEKLQPKL